MNAPTVGSVVVATTEHKTHYAYALAPTSTNTYSGTVLPPHKWMSAFEFRMKTFTRGFELEHVINMRFVVDLEIVSGSTVAPLQVRSVTVMGSKGSVYEVTESNGKVTCTCPSFTYRHSCKHLQELK